MQTVFCNIIIPTSWIKKVSSDQEKANLSKHIPGAQSDIDANEDDEEGQGAAMLSLKSHVKLKPDELSNITSPGKLRSKQPTYEPTTVSPFTNNTILIDKNQACIYCALKGAFSLLHRIIIY